ncbi:Uu.00g057440.m01.CDS01 [Anthostomella pinea]|uniref:Uu.00g057440.m01.CDS01 n=1 Tax=Anthostomella pinea TaxID=933095 RepID=A0AAI8YM73_9PEZI|nr:Uu.00g057440.m01.CDS01 [Anthostomella pinea]
MGHLHYLIYPDNDPKLARLAVHWATTLVFLWSFCFNFGTMAIWVFMIASGNPPSPNFIFIYGIADMALLTVLLLILAFLSVRVSWVERYFIYPSVPGLFYAAKSLLRRFRKTWQRIRALRSNEIPETETETDWRQAYGSSSGDPYQAASMIVFPSTSAESVVEDFPAYDEDGGGSSARAPEEGTTYELFPNAHLHDPNSGSHPSRSSLLKAKGPDRRPDSHRTSSATSSMPSISELQELDIDDDIRPSGSVRPPRETHNGNRSHTGREERRIGKVPQHHVQYSPADIQHHNSVHAVVVVDDPQQGSSQDGAPIRYNDTLVPKESLVMVRGTRLEETGRDVELNFESFREVRC